MDEKDVELYERLEACVLDSLDESKAIEFLAKLEVDEYSRLLELFEKMDNTVVPEDVKKKLVKMFEGLKKAKVSELA